MIENNNLSYALPQWFSKLTLTFWMSSTYTETFKSLHKLRMPNMGLYIQIQKTYTETASMDADTKKSLTYVVNFNNIYFIKKMCREAREWFEGELFDHLYGKTDTGTLLLNGDWSHLNASHSDSKGQTTTGMRIVPTVLTSNDGMGAPGVVVYVNTSNNYVLMDVETLIRFCDAIESTDLYQMGIFAMLGRMVSYSTQSLLSEEETQKQYIQNNQKRF